MYRGFKLNYDVLDDTYYTKGLETFSSDQADTRAAINKYISKDGILDGGMIKRDWFPLVKKDIFISHSHGNATNAITLAGWLYLKFGITSFIDSCVWGYADTLLYQIDQKYSMTTDGKLYNSRKRNRSTSHVHMMLATALMNMIDNCECLFFLNTPDTISAEKIIKEETESPWIYAEIAMSRMIRRNIPDRRHISEQTKLYSEGGVVNESLRIKYHMNLEDLPELTPSNLRGWEIGSTERQPKKALDFLYDFVKPITKDMLLKG